MGSRCENKAVAVVASVHWGSLCRAHENGGQVGQRTSRTGVPNRMVRAKQAHVPSLLLLPSGSHAPVASGRCKLLELAGCSAPGVGRQSDGMYTLHLLLQQRLMMMLSIRFLSASVVIV